MSFKFYKNKKTKHPSISIRQKNKKNWFNMPVSHSKPKKHSYIEIDDPHPLAEVGDKSYVQKYVRKDGKYIKGHPYDEYVLSEIDEINVKKYLSKKYKKDDAKLDDLSAPLDKKHHHLY